MNHHVLNMFGGADEPRRPLTDRRLLPRRLAGMSFAVLWLYPLIDTFRDVHDGKMPLAWLAGIGLVAFSLLYLVVVYLAFARCTVAPPRTHLILLWSLAAITLALAIGYAHQPDGGVLGLSIYVAVAGAATYRLPWGGIWVLGVIAVTVGIGRTFDIPAHDIGSFAFNAVMASALVLVVISMISLIRELRVTREALADAAVERERLRFARDLHDLLGHTLSVIVVKAEVARRLADRDPVATAQAAAEIETIGRQALAEVREAVAGYRVRSFAVELENSSVALADAGIATTSDVRPDLPGPVDEAFAWVVREASTNIIRHSRATTCMVTVTRGSSWRLEVRDDGVGGPAGVGGHGLGGLRERLNAIGGTLTTVAHPGFTVVAVVPVSTDDAEDK
ncbi:two-component system sensor histidine kinase DesK [Allocatelliglobosispora scoriae]|uniref:Two-component system sensor histidine kinase DesK n=1 Tax=Allocatelliglobosispora scoriae TaxID=643052 RepID=A0A841BRR6_9ACTN|nr:histidine kinase [Allocatelliglobosispora scoriae]MBB5870934.1 two-component system sensor histidine kinase DesK [Allocatelliglobosispora scoriae]